VVKFIDHTWEKRWKTMIFDKATLVSLTKKSPWSLAILSYGVLKTLNENDMHERLPAYIRRLLFQMFERTRSLDGKIY